MKYSDFIGEVQHRLELDSQGAAVRATRAVLTTLGERLGEGEADDLASPLPREIGRFLREAESGQRFSYQGFVERVADRAGVEARGRGIPESEWDDWGLVATDAAAAWGLVDRHERAGFDAVECLVASPDPGAFLEAMGSRL
ncbi:MAG: DUF2267 domain-containing protein [Haloferacaceae archaeon]